ncbi:alpha/beta fold hydrolase [Modestobacter sp. I12A-02662]|uniref:alpha/beta fold hydrolase n=1 Tax=Modestobacter sp. I12A-02662 TaxID=1730496 RepID=UPI0034DE0CB6
MTHRSSNALDRPGATLRYWTSHPAVPTSGPTLVLLHGATLDHHAWAPQVAALQDRFPLVTPDLRGHGASTGRFDYTAAVDDIEALLQVLPADRIVLVGHSLGGNIAQELVRRGNPRIRAMVVADATCNTAARHPMEAWMGVAALHAQAAVEGAAFAQRAAQATAIEPKVQRYALDANRHRSNQETVGILASLLTDALRPDPDYRLPVPTLLLCGEFDGIGDVARGSRAWARRDTLAHYAEIPGAGHTSNLDNPGAFTEVLEAFLRGVLPLESRARAVSPDVEAPAERVYT